MLKTNSAIDHKITGVTTVAEGASFRHVSFAESEFVGTVIFKSMFVKASLENVLFKDCKIKSSDFIKTNLRNAVFNNCAISHCDFSMACLRGVRFILSDAEAHEFLTTCIFDHAKMKGATINGASLYEEVLKYKK